MRRLALVLLVICAALPAGGVHADEPQKASGRADPCTAAHKGGSQNFGFAVNGTPRVAHMHVPAAGSPAGQRLPLLIALHGYGGSGSGMEAYTGFSALADSQRFLAVYPDALGRTWAIHDGAARGAKDIEFIKRLIDDVQDRFCVNRRRVFVVGVSNGGGEASRLACALSGRLAAVALVAGSYGHEPHCQPEKPLSILEIHSQKDPVVPYKSGAGSVPRFLALWRAIDHCKNPARHRRLDKMTFAARWLCAAGTRVSALRIARGGHFWPGATQHGARPGPTSAAARIWSFFRAVP